MPTNQSGLGPIIDNRVTSGWSLATSIRNVAVLVPPPPMLCLMTAAAWGEALISDSNRFGTPRSATTSTPGEARPPGLQKVTLPLCTAPINVVKCAPATTPSGVLAVVQLP